MRPASFPRRPARVPTAHRNSQGRTGRDNSNESSRSAAGVACKPDGIREASSRHSKQQTRGEKGSWLGMLLAVRNEKLLPQRIELVESRRAYVKIESRIVARSVREGITFVLFAADIPSIPESFGAGALAGEYSLGGAASLGEARAFFRLAVPASCCCTKSFVSRFERAGRQFRRCGSRIRAQRENDLRRRAQEQVSAGNNRLRGGVLRLRQRRLAGYFPGEWFSLRGFPRRASSFLSSLQEQSRRNVYGRNRAGRPAAYGLGPGRLHRSFPNPPLPKSLLDSFRT